MKDSVQQMLQNESRLIQSVVESNIESLVVLLASGIIDHPEQMTIQTSEKNKLASIVVTPADPDVGKMIGGKGRMFHSFKTVLEHFVASRGLRINYRIINQRQENPSRIIDFKANPNWREEAPDKLFAEQCGKLFLPGFTLRREDEAILPKTRYFLSLAKDEPEWSGELQLALSYIWHATAYRLGRKVFLETMNRRPA